MAAPTPEEIQAALEAWRRRVESFVRDLQEVQRRHRIRVRRPPCACHPLGDDNLDLAEIPEEEIELAKGLRAGIRRACAGHGLDAVAQAAVRDIERLATEIANQAAAELAPQDVPPETIARLGSLIERLRTRAAPSRWIVLRPEVEPEAAPEPRT